MVGEPRIGAQVRKMQASLRCENVDLLVAAFRQAHPSSKALP